MDLKPYIRDVPDFPKPGIVFKDITTLLAEPKAFRHIISTWEKRYAHLKIGAVIGIESRGFIFGAPLAERLHVKFVPARKPGKLPYKTVHEEYELEYGTDAIAMHEDALEKGERVVIIDDLLATGGTAHAAAKLTERIGGVIEEMAFVVELAFLNARARKLDAYKIHSLVSYDAE